MFDPTAYANMINQGQYPTPPFPMSTNQKTDQSPDPAKAKDLEIQLKIDVPDPAIVIKKDEKPSYLEPNVEIKEVDNEDEISEYKKQGIKQILKYFIENIGRSRTEKLMEERERYINNQSLLHFFDLVMKKFIMSNKTKEEKIKYVLRKAFKYLGEKLKNEMMITKSAKTKKEFDRIFNDYYMSGKKKVDQEAPRYQNAAPYKLIFT